MAARSETCAGAMGKIGLGRPSVAVAARSETYAEREVGDLAEREMAARSETCAERSADRR